MNIKIVNLPFYYIYFSLVLLLVNFHFESSLWIWLPEIILFTVQLILKIKYTKFQIALFILCFVILLKDIIFLQKIISLPIVSIVFSSIVILQIIKYYSSLNTFKKYIKYFSYFLLLNFIFIALEAVSFNYESTFFSLIFNGIYKPSIEGYGKVPQSLFNQSQSGAQIIMLTMFWYLLSLKFYFKSNLYKSASIFIICISFLLLFLFPNSTVYLILLFTILIFPNLVLPSRYFKWILYIIFCLTLVISVEYFINLFNYKLFNQLGEISNSYFSPVYYFNKISFLEKLFGVKDINYFVDLEADFTYGILILKNGLLTFLLFLFLILLVLYKYAIKTSKCNFSNNTRIIYFLINKFSMLVIFSSILSLFHYPFVINFGARQFFALNIALFVYTRQNIIYDKK